MLPAHAVTVVGGLGLVVLKTILLFQGTDFVSTFIQMFETFAWEMVVCKSQNNTNNLTNGPDESKKCSFNWLNHFKIQIQNNFIWLLVRLCILSHHKGCSQSLWSTDTDFSMADTNIILYYTIIAILLTVVRKTNLTKWEVTKSGSALKNSVGIFLNKHKFANTCRHEAYFLFIIGLMSGDTGWCWLCQTAIISVINRTTDWAYL